MRNASFANDMEGVQCSSEAMQVQVVHVRHAVHRAPCVVCSMHVQGKGQDNAGIGAYQTDTCDGWSRWVKLSVIPAPTKMLVNARTPMSIMFLNCSTAQTQHSANHFIMPLQQSSCLGPCLHVLKALQKH